MQNTAGCDLVIPCTQPSTGGMLQWCQHPLWWVEVDMYPTFTLFASKLKVIVQVFQSCSTIITKVSNHTVKIDMPELDWCDSDYMFPIHNTKFWQHNRSLHGN